MFAWLPTDERSSRFSAVPGFNLRFSKPALYTVPDKSVTAQRGKQVLQARGFSSSRQPKRHSNRLESLPDLHGLWPSRRSICVNTMYPYKSRISAELYFAFLSGRGSFRACLRLPPMPAGKGIFRPGSVLGTRSNRPAHRRGGQRPCILTRSTVSRIMSAASAKGLAAPLRVP